MATELLLTLALGGSSAAGFDGQAADDFVAELVADLNEIEGVLAEPGQEPQPGSKAIGSLLLGQLTAQLNGKNALKVLGYLKRRLIDQPPPAQPPQAAQPPLRIKLSHTTASGEAVALELEAPASEQAALLAMFDRAEAFVARQV